MTPPNAHDHSAPPAAHPAPPPRRGLGPLWTLADEIHALRRRALTALHRRRQRQRPPHARAAWATLALTLATASVWLLAPALRTPADQLAASTQRAALICAETGRLFPTAHLRDGDTFPARNPSTGRRTLYPASVCHGPNPAPHEPVHLLPPGAIDDAGGLCPLCGLRGGDRARIGH